jgi:transcriptional regulator with XRE-family HTH domain
VSTFLSSKDLGFKLRQLRQLAGITQEQLAEKIGVTSQQIQKYESGQNTMNADRLQQFAEIFSVPVQEFFCEYTEVVQLKIPERALLDAFRGIENADIQESILKLTIYSAKVKE